MQGPDTARPPGHQLARLLLYQLGLWDIRMAECCCWPRHPLGEREAYSQTCKLGYRTFSLQVDSSDSPLIGQTGEKLKANIQRLTKDTGQQTMQLNLLLGYWFATKVCSLKCQTRKLQLEVEVATLWPFSSSSMRRRLFRNQAATTHEEERAATTLNLLAFLAQTFDFGVASWWQHQYVLPQHLLRVAVLAPAASSSQASRHRRPAL